MPRPSSNFLGLVLREARRRAGISQRELAARSGQPVGTVASVEGGSRDASVTRYAAMLAACGWGFQVVDDDGTVVDVLVDTEPRDKAGVATRPTSDCGRRLRAVRGGATASGRTGGARPGPR